MLKTQLAVISAAAALLGVGAGAANADQSVFPSSVSEAPALSIPYEGKRNVDSAARSASPSRFFSAGAANADQSVFPFSVSESPALSIPYEGMTARSRRVESASSARGTFPSSVDESM